jgi:hypothetical protein
VAHRSASGGSFAGALYRDKVFLGLRSSTPAGNTLPALTGDFFIPTKLPCNLLENLELSASVYVYSPAIPSASGDTSEQH